VRHLPEGLFDPEDFSRTGLAMDNRWNARGEPTLYLARDHSVALAEWARHLDTDRAPFLAKYTRRRQVYRFQITLNLVLDLCEPTIWNALSLRDAPQVFLNKAAARATAQFIRYTTPAVAIFTPSIAFLDRLDQWVLVIFLEKLGDTVQETLHSVGEAGSFSLA